VNLLVVVARQEDQLEMVMVQSLVAVAALPQVTLVEALFLGLVVVVQQAVYGVAIQQV
jgi:hypothetical protein